MTYELEFDRRALKEWNKLGDTVRQQFKKNWLRSWRILESKPIGFASYQTAIK